MFPEQAFKSIDDVLWKEAGCTTELDYTEQTSWLLFLKYLDGLERVWLFAARPLMESRPRTEFLGVRATSGGGHEGLEIPSDTIF